MSFIFYPYSDLQIKQRHNSKMLYHSYLDVYHTYILQFRYKMLWQKHKGGYQLLAKHNLKTNKREYLGRRDSETEKIALDFVTAKKEIKERLKHLKTKLLRDEKLNKLEGIARAPKELISLFRKINELGLDDKLVAIGTNSLYAYEARAGIRVEEDHLATRDIDILNRKEKGVSFLASTSMSSSSAIDLLQSIDKSFYQSEKAPYRFINKSGVWVELICPGSDLPVSDSSKDMLFTDVIPLAMDGMHWLENSRLFRETVIAENGKSADITTVHPLEYAIYKNWLGQREDRDFQKHTRDIQQSKLVTKMMLDYMPNINIESEVKQLKHFKKEVVEDYMKHIYKV